MVVIEKEGESPMIESVQRQSEKFDGLANDYDRYRPRYPLTLFKTMPILLRTKSICPLWMWVLGQASH